MATLVREDVAIFPGIDLGTIHALGLPTKDLRGVTNAFDIIAGYKVGSLDTASARVPPIGAGNTAIDNAVAAVRLGAQGGQEVTMVCRRSPAADVHLHLHLRGRACTPRRPTLPLEPSAHSHPRRSQGMGSIARKSARICSTMLSMMGLTAGRMFGIGGTSPWRDVA